MFIYHRNVSVSIVVAIIRKRNNDALTNNIFFFSKYIHTYIHRQTDTHTFAFIYKKKKITTQYTGNLLWNMYNCFSVLNRNAFFFLFGKSDWAIDVNLNVSILLLFMARWKVHVTWMPVHPINQDCSEYILITTYIDTGGPQLIDVMCTCKCVGKLNVCKLNWFYQQQIMLILFKLNYPDVHKS
jgi:hypothetical protein